MIAEIDAEVQQRLRKWNKFLESGAVAVEHRIHQKRIKGK
jgi:hypothetical protein